MANIDEHTFAKPSIEDRQKRRAKRTDRFIKQDTFWYFHITGGLIQSWQVFEDTEQVGWAWDDRAARRAD